MKMDRKQYLTGEVSHEDYYGQFVTDYILDYVGRHIGVERIKKSTDEHFNDIPLKEWDGLIGWPDRLRMFGLGQALRTANNGGGVSCSDMICVMKAAARKIKAE